MNTVRQPLRLRLVVPCYNEAKRLPRDAFLDFVRATPAAALLFVNDGSTDQTASVLAALSARSEGRIEVLELPHNSGKAEAVRRGVLAAVAGGTEYVGYWDADLSTPLDAVPLFTAILDDRLAVDIVMGARVKLLGRHVHRKMFRHYTGRLFATAASVTLGLAVYDTQCGAKVFRSTGAIADAFAEPFRSSWAFDVEVLARYLAAVGRQRGEVSIYELPLATWTDVPGSKVKPWHALRVAWDLARIWTASRRGRSAR